MLALLGALALANDEAIFTVFCTSPDPRCVEQL